MFYSVSLERGLPLSFNASQKLLCVRLLDKTVNLIHRLQRADQSEVLRVLPRWCDDPKANGAIVYSTYVAKQIDGVWCRSVRRPGQMDVRRGLGHRLKSWRTFPRSSSWHHTHFG